MAAVRLERWRPASERGDVFAGLFRVCREPLASRLHETLIARTMDGHLVEHISRDATAIEAREKPAPKAAKPKRRRKRGRPRKGEARAKEPSRLERQLDEPSADAGGPAEGLRCRHQAQRRPYHLLDRVQVHVDTADGIPISCIMTSASTHDSQVAIPLGTLTAGRRTTLWTRLMIPSRSGRTASCWATSDHRREPPPLGRNARGVEA